MYLPPGFKAEAVVSEPDIHQPIAMAFDERGRIWVAEAYSYPVRQPEGQGLDKIVIFEDTDGDWRLRCSILGLPNPKALEEGPEVSSPRQGQGATS
jgi:hypothetical protein